MTATLFNNGTIRTDALATETFDWLLVEDGRVAGSGNRDDEPSADRSVDLNGGALIPAFCDAHVHLPATGLYAGGMDFRGEHSADAILAAFDRHAQGGGAVMFGGNFEDPLDHPLTRHDLDRVVVGRPAMLARADMHSCIVSSALLEQFDLTDIEGVDRDEAGEPTGYLREQAACGAWNWFDASLPREEQIAAIRAAARLAYSKGVATVHEMFVVEWRGWPSYDVFTDAIEGLALNVVTYLGTDEVDKVKSLGMRQIGGDYFLDGSFGSHTAWLTEPFASPPPEGSPPNGIKYRDDDDLFEYFLASHRAGLQVGVHAIGDAAIEQGIATWERVSDEEGLDSVKARRHRIEHFECASDEHIRRAAKLGLKGSVQPAFDHYWGGERGLYADRIGWGRAASMNRFKSMAEAGIDLGAGSDSTVTPLDPFLQMQSLRLHHIDDERVDAHTALWLHTAGSHALAPPPRRGDGKLDPGAPAHIVWLDRDAIITAPEELTDIQVLGTWIEGMRVWPEDDSEATRPSAK
jgi:predicted amidohydrolase YtcJ